MKVIRRFGIIAATAAIGFGIVGFAAPAHADMSWGYGISQPAR